LKFVVTFIQRIQYKSFCCKVSFCDFGEDSSTVEAGLFEDSSASTGRANVFSVDAAEILKDSIACTCDTDDWLSPASA
jgi:hypothetical protein